MEAIYQNIFSKAQELIHKNYEEKNATFKLSKCNTILINHRAKSFWYTIKSDAENIISLIKNNK